MDRHVSAAVAALAVLAIAGCKSDRQPAATSAAPPARIITLTPSATRLVIAAGALDRLVATDQYSVEPAAVKALPKVGDFLAPNVEAIAKLEPDLVIADDVQSKATASLRGLGIEVLSIKMHSIADIRRELAAVARATGEPERGKQALAAIEAALDRARENSRRRQVRPRVLWIMDRQPAQIAGIVAAGPGSFAAELIELVGARNALAGSIRYPRLSRESLVKIDADVIIDASAAAGTSLKAWRGTPWRVVAGATDLATPGPGIVDAVAEVESLVFAGEPGTDKPPAP